MLILYFGADDHNSTSFHRIKALERLGHSVVVFNPFNFLPAFFRNGLVGKVQFHTGYILVQQILKKKLKRLLAVQNRIDLIWVDGGEYFGGGCVQIMRAIGCPIVLYNVDDPTGKRDGLRFYSTRKALALYDLVVAVRSESETEALQYGAKNVLRVYRSYDELAHQPFQNFDQVPNEFRSEVTFIGTWMRHERRDEFLLSLIQQGIPISIWGNRWEKSPYFIKLQPYYRGKGVIGKDYVAAIQGSKICIGLLSKGNRDLHTTRSLEIPYAGGLFCAERTSEHLYLYKDGEEAVFWKDAEECASICKVLLDNPERRESIRLRGMEKVRFLKVGNEDILKKVIDKVLYLENKNK